LVAAMALTWRLLVSSLWPALRGRPAVWAACVGLRLVYWIAVSVFVGWFLSQGDPREVVREMLPSLKRMFEWVPWSTWGIQGAFVLKVWTAAWGWHEAVRSGLVSSRAVITYLFIWVAVTGCLIALPYLVLSAARFAGSAPELELVFHVEWLRPLFALAM